MDICTFSDELVEYAKVQKMQDLSILPTVEGMTLIFSKSYYRQMYRKVTTEDAQQLITRFKFLGGMEVGEKRRAQLGAISYPWQMESSVSGFRLLGISKVKKV